MMFIKWIFIFLLLSSCGKTLTVRFAETALLWQIDNYFDINSDQRDGLKKKFRSTLKTLDSTAVSDLEKIILDDRMPRLSCDETNAQYKKMQPFVEQIFLLLSSASSDFIDSLSSEQIQFFTEKLNKKLADDELDLADLDSTERRIKHARKIWTELFGNLSAAQVITLENQIKSSDHFRHQFLQSRKKNIAVFIQKSKLLADAKIHMKDYLKNWKNYQTDELKKSLVNRDLNNEKFITQFFCTAQSEQKINLQKTVAQYLDLARKTYIR